ncbi:MAG TPA: ABC transporter ATP-binding protein [Candidatus Omnitrophota bacterium]|nr:ABC transporter ATP-binding protein [Candidatus Omnitrophota bacterium]
MAEESLIKVENLSKKFCASLRRSMWYGVIDTGRAIAGVGGHSERLRRDEFWALQGVSFRLERGQTLGIVGANGAGKTTLLRLLNGIIMPDTGQVSIGGRVGALIGVGAGFHPLLTGRENIFVNAAILGMDRRRTLKAFDAIVDFAGIGGFLDAPVRHYSSGMFMRLAFSVAVHCDPEILLIDEVLAVGDTQFQERCFNRLGLLRSQGVSTILVSHSMMHILGFCDSALYLKRGMVQQIGAPETVIRAYQDDVSAAGVPALPAGNSSEHGPETDVAVRRVEWVSGQGEVVEKAFAGSDVLLRIHYNARQDIGPVEMDIAVSGAGSDVLFRTSSKSFHKDLAVRAGEGYFDIRLKALAFNNQHVMAHAALWRADRSQLLFWQKDIPLFVSGDIRCGGRIIIDVDWKNIQ